MPFFRFTIVIRCTEDFSGLWPMDQRDAEGADVLNGIANCGDHVFITGKLWNRMYKVKLLV